MTRNAIRCAAAALVLALAAAPAVTAVAADTSAAAAAEDARFERDRQAILAMAGDYHVRFAFDETTAFDPAYSVLEPKRSGGHEVVRVIEDTGERIVLQHLLVAEHEGQSFVIKHWRQDWVYEPETVLTYVDRDTWQVVAVPAEDRAGAWSQTVWQTDDSPRYGGVGRWRYDGGVAAWESHAERPLARRDAIRHPPFDHYAAMNRHALTPAGWIHAQDNEKRVREGEGARTIVHEFGVNTYRRFDQFDVAAADAYWAATADYWAQVRAAWDAAIAAGDGRLTVEEEPQAGSVTGPELMGLADRLAAGELDQAAAVARARTVIAEAAGVRLD